MGAIKTRPGGTKRPIMLAGNEPHYTYGDVKPDTIELADRNVCLVDQFVSGKITIARAASFLLHTAEKLSSSILCADNGTKTRMQHTPIAKRYHTHVETYMRMISRESAVL